MASPYINQRTCAEFLKEFPLVEVRGISYSSIGTVRDAFCQVLLKLQSERLRASVLKARSTSTSPLLCIVHFHDGVDMRLRTATTSLQDSMDVQIPASAQQLSQGRNCKIQNHAIQIFLGPSGRPWLTDLTPMERKDAASMGTSILIHLDAILTAACVQDWRCK